MAASESSSSPEVFSWLKSLPVAPEYYPTPAEFQDPIAYIFKIEKEASRFGICKIVPPVPAPARKTVLANLNQSLEARNGGDGGDRSFATRQQQIGFCPRRPRPVQRPVWQSGERYVFAEFEAKAKSFERGFLRKCSKKGGSSSSSAAMEIETMYWKATLDKPFTVEYANDMPGSAFSPSGEGLADSAWNMRTVSRAKGSLLRFMKEEIPGVTSPMVYVAMLFSWFAWHVEDHDLHSLNYLHMGAGKTWYGVPREAAAAFEEVVRVQGYNAEINPLVTFSILGEKTTVMSPDVFVRAGVPCCRLVQNAGEFVVTFPRAYHTGFSHGFNCAEAANIATPEWLALAKDAAIRRASINYPPMVSHFQLLYDLALELCSRIPLGINTEPRSSRLKDKKKGEGETVVKEIFVQNVIENNDLLHALGKGSPIVLLPKIYSDSPVYPEFRVGLQSRFNYRVPLASCNSREEKASSKGLISDDTMLDRKQDEDKVEGFYSMKGKLASLCEGSWVPSFRGNKLTPASNHNAPNTTSGTEYSSETNGLSNNRLFSCVTCGILSFACVALIKPKEPAARYLMSADCSIFNDWAVNPGVANRVFSASNVDHTASKQNTTGGWTGTSAPPHDIPVVSTSYGVQTKDQTNDLVSNSVTNKCSSALGLLALNYGNSSDSDEDPVQEDQTVDDRETSGANCFSERTSQCTSSSSTFLKNDIRTGNGCDRDNISHQSNGCDNKSEDNDVVRKGSDSLLASRTCSPDTYDAEATKFCKAMTPKTNGNMPLTQVCDHDSSRLHVFCLEHALEVEQQLCEIGGVHIQLLCHPDYSKIETEAKAMAEELGLSHVWNDITVREATKDDEETIQSALDSEEGMPKNGDWAVKLGINLFYSANLSRSPLYSKQMPYNSVIYNAFGRSSPGNLSARPSGLNRKSSRQRKFLVGKWCGKVWMSNQVHPLLVERDSETEGGEETGRGFNGREPNVKPMRKSDVARRNLEYSTSSITKKYTRKRKLGGVGHDTKKGKRVKREDDEILDHSPDVDSHEHHRTRSLTSKNAFRNEARSAKKSKHVELEDEPSDDSMGNAGSSRKQNKSAIRRKKPAHIDTGEGVSDNSLVSFGRLHEQILRRKRANHRLRRDDLDSEDSLDCDSHRVRVTVPSNNQAKPSEHESVEDSDDSADTDSHLPARKISKGKLARFTEREDSTSDDFQENHPRKRYTKNKKKKTTKRKPAKPVEMEEEEEQEEEDVDESVVNMRTRRSKLTKSTRKKTKQEPRNPKQNTPSSGEEDPVEEPRTRLRKRAVKPQKKSTPSLAVKRRSKPTDDLSGAAIGAEEGEHGCDVEGCTMSFGTRQELVLHKRNICPIKGCGKKFFSHKYLVQHRRVHVDDRPLRCPWKGCKMTFKWPWARTEHIRVHTGARPYICAEPGCGQTFRFVSDFSRHKRKTGHSVKKGR